MHQTAFRNSTRINQEWELSKDESSKSTKITKDNWVVNTFFQTNKQASHTSFISISIKFQISLIDSSETRTYMNHNSWLSVIITGEILVHTGITLCISDVLLIFPCFRKPFPIGDKVTFSGKDCVCQTCSHSLISNKPIKIHGPSRKSVWFHFLYSIQRRLREGSAVKTIKTRGHLAT